VAESVKPGSSLLLGSDAAISDWIVFMREIIEYGRPTDIYVAHCTCSRPDLSAKPTSSPASSLDGICTVVCARLHRTETYVARLFPTAIKLTARMPVSTREKQYFLRSSVVGVPQLNGKPK
jgi:hypothetical protein